MVIQSINVRFLDHAGYGYNFMLYYAYGIGIVLFYLMVRYNDSKMEVKPMKDQVILIWRCIFGLLWGITFFYGEGLYKLGDFITIC